MKKFFSVITMLVLCIATLLGSYISVEADSTSSTTNAPTRVINVVYDDSGSMIYDTATKAFCDTWCQAKYSMEVFAAMLGEKDTMNIYVMSDFYKTDGTAGPQLRLKGSSGAKSNVSAVHNMITPDGGTPFNAVKKAYSDLNSTSADEKWLIVLTDGMFRPDDGDEDGKDVIDMPMSEVNSFFSQKSSSVNVVYLAIGQAADTISQNTSKNIYAYKASDSSQVLSKITEICQRVYNSNRLTVNTSTNKFEFDVPMGELIVFAQGENVHINGIKNSSGKNISGSGNPVEVKFSEQPSTRTKYTTGDRKNGVLVDRKLKGSIQYFKGDYDAGTYTLDVTGAETVEIYYKPNVSIVTYLTDEKGNIISKKDEIGEGTYSISYEIVRSTNVNEKIGKSKLLGDFEFSATITNGSKKNVKIKPGEKFDAVEGKLEINGTATYLEINTIRNSVTYTILGDKGLEIKIIDTPQYTLEGMGITGSNEPIVAKITMEGKDLTADQWNQFKNEDFTVSATGTNSNTFSFKAEKTSTPGILNVYPSVDTSKAKAKKYDKVDITIEADCEFNGQHWYGKDDTTISFTDMRSKGLVLTVTESPTYTVEATGIGNANSPIVVKAGYSDRELTAEEWATLSNLTVKKKGIGDRRIVLTAEKTATPGVFYIYPSAKDGKITNGIYSDFDFTAETEGQYGMDELSGKTTGTVHFADSRTAYEKYKPYFIAGFIFLGIALLFGSYWVKPKLPNDLKAKPLIKYKTDMLGGWKETVGSMTKEPLYVIAPFVPERATVKVTPTMVHGIDKLKIRAKRGGMFVITNCEKVVAGQGNSASVNGKSMKDCKGHEYGSGVTISGEDKKGVKFSCKLNEAKKAGKKAGKKKGGKKGP